MRIWDSNCRTILWLQFLIYRSQIITWANSQHHSLYSFPCPTFPQDKGRLQRKPGDSSLVTTCWGPRVMYLVVEFYWSLIIASPNSQFFGNQAVIKIHRGELASRGQVNWSRVGGWLNSWWYYIIYRSIWFLPPPFAAQGIHSRVRSEPDASPEVAPASSDFEAKKTYLSS